MMPQMHCVTPQVSKSCTIAPFFLICASSETVVGSRQPDAQGASGVRVHQRHAAQGSSGAKPGSFISARVSFDHEWSGPR